MANKIQLKRPSAYASTTAPSSLVYGEPSWVNGDSKLVIGKQTDAGGTIDVFHLPTLRDLTAGDGLDASSPTNADGSITLSLDLKVKWWIKDRFDRSYR